MRGNALLHSQQLQLLRANGERRKARKATRRPGAERRAFEAASGSAFDRAVEAMDKLVPGQIAEMEANLIRELAITYERRTHLPYVALLIGWEPCADTEFFLNLPTGRIINRLWEAIFEDRQCRRIYGRWRYTLAVRRLVRRAYLAERLARLRARAADAQNAQQAEALRYARAM